jgi:hypothetical protein
LARKPSKAAKFNIETLDILQPLPGVAGHARLRVGLDCRSAAIAGKVLSGKHIGNRWWEAVLKLDVGIPS